MLMDGLPPAVVLHRTKFDLDNRYYSQYKKPLYPPSQYGTELELEKSIRIPDTDQIGWSQ